MSQYDQAVSAPFSTLPQIYNIRKGVKSGNKDYLCSRFAVSNSDRKCTECFQTIEIGAEHHQALGYYRSDCYEDRRTCTKCLRIWEIINQDPVLMSRDIERYRFGRLFKLLRIYRDNYPDEFNTFQQDNDCPLLIARAIKQKGWNNSFPVCTVEILERSKPSFCHQCSVIIPPNTPFERVVAMQNDYTTDSFRTCLHCVETRKILSSFATTDEDFSLRLYQRRKEGLFELVDELAKHRSPELNPKIQELLDHHIAAKIRLEKEWEEQCKVEPIKPATTKYETMLKKALDKAGFNVIHNQRLGYYFPDLRIDLHHCIIEVDGGYHNTEEQQQKDAVRTRWLNSQGFFVVRVSNKRVKNEINLVVRDINDAIKDAQNVHLG